MPTNVWGKENWLAVKAAKELLGEGAGAVNALRGRFAQFDDPHRNVVLDETPENVEAAQAALYEMETEIQRFKAWIAEVYAQIPGFLQIREDCLEGYTPPTEGE